MKISIIGMPLFYGCDNPGVEKGPEELRKNNLIDIFEKNNNIVFKIKNTFDGKIKKINENYITTKEGNIHGLGIHRVISTVNKYNGVIYMNNDENIFENKVIIPIN